MYLYLLVLFNSKIMNHISNKNKLAWHSNNVDEVILKLKSNIRVGLFHTEAKIRLEKYGKNILPRPKRRSLLSLFIHQFLSPLIYLLIGAFCIALFVGEAKDALVILVVVIINAIIGSLQEKRAEQSLEELLRLSKLKARMLRSSEELLVEASEIVPGDILILNTGDAVLADARLFEVSSLAASEAGLTGESLPILKSTASLPLEKPVADRSNMVYAGTHITAGRGHGIVVATGMNTEIGKIANLSSVLIHPKSKIELSLQKFGKFLISLAFIVFFLVVGVGLLHRISLTQILMIAISQIVSLVPEGLPVAMTIALAVGVQRMAKRGAIVRNLSAVETLGTVTVICSDKTGTLTRNEMVVTNLYLPVGKRELTVTGVGYEPQGCFIENNCKINPNIDMTLKKLFEASILCNDAQLLVPTSTDTKWRILGDPTEGALLTFASKSGMAPSLIKKKNHRKAELPFDSDSKMMATQYEIDGREIIFIKGAPENLLEICDSAYDGGHIKMIDDLMRSEIGYAAKKMADLALRTLAVGYIQDTFIDGKEGYAHFKGKVTMIGLIGEMDPPRQEVAHSIKECQSAGIRPVMITGDHKATGLAIATTLGICRDGDLAIDGQELDQLSDQHFLEIIDKIRVFARVHPLQKLRIVEAYRRKGEVVAMTGDGANDAPALVHANVGVAMGLNGSEVAKEAAAIVITDDNFATILIAVAEGRLVYQNIKKLILFLLVTSLDEVFILFLALVLGYPPPLMAIQILWINLVTEGALTLNLIMEPPEGNEMLLPPIPVDQPIIDRALLFRIPLMVLASVTSTLGWFIYRSSLNLPPALVQTETFTVLVVCQWFNVLNCRSNLDSIFSRKIFKNRWLLVGLFFANALHASVIYYPPLNHLFHTVAIAPSQLFLIGLVGSLVVWVEELRKIIARKFNFLFSNSNDSLSSP